MSYFGYKRGDKPRVNWGGLAEKFSQDLLAEKASRDERKKSIADAQAKELAELDKQAVTPKTSVNSEIIRSSNDARQAYLTNVRLMRRGLIKPSTARAGQQRLADGYKMYNQYMTTWAEEYKKFVTDRTDVGDELDDLIQQDHFKFGNVEQWGLVVDPNNMNLLMGLKDKDGNVDMSKTVDMANIVNTNQDFHDEFDAVTYYNNLGDKIVGIIETSEQSKLGDADFLKIFEDYYAMGDPQEFIDAVNAAEASGDYSAVQEMNPDASDGSGLTNYGLAYFNMFQTINAGLGSVDARDRTSALTQIGYDLVNVSDDVDLETLQSEAKYNKEGSKEIYVYRDEQGLLQPYLSESQNKDFEKDGLYRSLAAKDFQIETTKIVGKGGGFNFNPSDSEKEFNAAYHINKLMLRYPGSSSAWNGAVSNVLAENDEPGSLSADASGSEYTLNFGGKTFTFSESSMPTSNAQFEEWATSWENGSNKAPLESMISQTEGFNILNYGPGPSQSSKPGKTEEYKKWIQQVRAGIATNDIDFGTSRPTGSYDFTAAPEVSYGSFTATTFAPTPINNILEGLSKALKSGNIAGANNAITKLRGWYTDAANEVKNIAAQETNSSKKSQLEDLADRLDDVQVFFDEDNKTVTVGGYVGYTVDGKYPTGGYTIGGKSFGADIASEVKLIGK